MKKTPFTNGPPAKRKLGNGHTISASSIGGGRRGGLTNYSSKIDIDVPFGGAANLAGS